MTLKGSVKIVFYYYVFRESYCYYNPCINSQSSRRLTTTKKSKPTRANEIGNFRFDFIKCSTTI